MVTIFCFLLAVLITEINEWRSSPNLYLYLDTRDSHSVAWFRVNQANVDEQNKAKRFANQQRSNVDIVLAGLYWFLKVFKIPSSAGNLSSNSDFWIHTIWRWSHLKTWNQSQVALNIPNFNHMKQAHWHLCPVWSFSILSDGLRL